MIAQVLSRVVACVRVVYVSLASLMLTHYCCFLLVLVPSAPVIPPNPMAGINSITIEWTQPAGPTVDSYSIAYSYDLVECPGEVQGTGSVSNISGNATSYMLTDLRSYADYTIMLSAENGNGLTSAANVVVRTADASKSFPYCCVIVVAIIIIIITIIIIIIIIMLLIML